MNGRIKTTDLQRLMKNGLLYFSHDSVTKGKTLWIRGATTLRVLSTDDYFVLSDTADIISGGTPEYGFLDLSALRTSEKGLRESSDEYTELGDISFEPADSDPDLYQQMEWLDRTVFATDSWKEMPVAKFAVYPDRLQKLSLVEPKREYPIDIKGFEDPETGWLMLAFRLGPTVRGLISPCARDTLEELYSGEELWR